MAREHIVNITNGQGSIELVNDTYTVTSKTPGYDNTTILPVIQEITDGINEYSFTVAATGILTLHTSDDGTATGNPIIGATFTRCDINGINYGNIITSDNDGNAIFNAVPYSVGENGTTIYYKQLSSDGQHDFDDTLKNTTLSESTTTIEIENVIAPTRNINFTDATYSGLPIANGQITLSTE